MSESVIPKDPLMPNNVARWLIVMLAIAGWFVSFDLTQHSMRIGHENSLVGRTCGGPRENPSDCLRVLFSEYGTFAFGNTGMRIPVAAKGAAYFLFVGVWFAFIGTPYRRVRWHLLISAVVLTGCWQSAQYIWLMAFTLERWCTWCSIAHAINGAILALTIYVYPWRDSALPPTVQPRTRVVLPTLLAGFLAATVQMMHVLLVIALLGKTTVEQKFRETLIEPEYVRWNYERHEAVDMALREDEMSAHPDARWTAVVYGDFECSACRRAHDMLEDVRHKYPALRVVYRHYPLDGACHPDPKFDIGGHPHACEAAYAAEAARQLGGDGALASMRVGLYGNQTQLGADLYHRLAAQAEVDPEQHATTMQSDAVKQRIQEDLASGAAIGLEDTGVPVVLLDGRRISGWQFTETWDTLLGSPAEATSQPGAD